MKYFPVINTYSLFFIFIIFSDNSFGQITDTNPLNKSRQDMWLEDLEYFENSFLNESKTYSADSVLACKKRIDNLKLKLDSLTDNQITLELSKCVAMANNGHTTIHLSWMKKIPIRFFSFSDGKYIIKTDSANSKYLGCKVLQINDINIDDVEARLMPYLSGIDRWKRYTAMNYLCSPQVLNGIGLSAADSLTLTLIYKEDTIKTDFGVSEMKNSKYEYLTWSDLYPDQSEDEWKHVLQPGKDLPFYLYNMKRGVFYKFYDDQQIAYFSINALWYKCPDFKGAVNAFIDSLKMKPGYDVVIDLRYFTGGNYMIPLKLATRPPKIIGDDQNIFLITSNMTFSAGLVTAARVKYYAGDKIIIVGDTVGDNLRFRAEGIYYKLPNKKISIQDSKAWHDWENDEFILFKTFFFNLFLGVPAKNLDIDKEIKLSFDDYINHNDPIMEWILDQ